MKISLGRWFHALSAIAFLHVAGCAAAAPAGEPVPRIAEGKLGRGRMA